MASSVGSIDISRRESRALLAAAGTGSISSRNCSTFIQILDLQSLICGVIRSIKPLLRPIKNILSIALQYEVG